MGKTRPMWNYTIIMTRRKIIYYIGRRVNQVAGERRPSASCPRSR
jgi:hypothetical protein